MEQQNTTTGTSDIFDEEAVSTSWNEVSDGVYSTDTVQTTASYTIPPVEWDDSSPYGSSRILDRLTAHYFQTNGNRRGYNHIRIEPIPEVTKEELEELRRQEDEEREKRELEKKILEQSVQTSRKNKAMAEWSISSRILKSLIKDVSKRPSGSGGMARYKFSASWDFRRHLWYIWNKKTENAIATVKVIDGKMYIRYRKNSFYSPVLRDIVLEQQGQPVKVTAIESDNLSRHREIAREYQHASEASPEELMAFRLNRRGDNGKHNG